ncbi:NAD-dependent deacylase [Bartonella sp. HY329]|uniref:NAD-dependent deacylase n=1 Tax=unclassified Bartonella TaxID=2645622 RepID=UPI0021C6E183|nr:MULTISPECIES: NAD-dependent deacylase [unclassified Bartonella]UXM94553.1 NAD-dependent deacylase [Bartonella sp. HY329]UXN08877.1 NAD-dependent deacylase [Bartonella sp. HY328]
MYRSSKIQSAPAILILTGAGISAESGIPTFRDSGGTWNNYSVEKVATPQGFAHDPQLVYDFYNKRRQDAKLAKPNAAHFALAELEEKWPSEFLLVTQNVDSLHEAAGSIKILHMHGQLNSALCAACHSQNPWQGDMDEQSQCPSCGTIGSLRPDIVWFGEMPYHMEKIELALSHCDIFAAIGTSGQVYPAAGFVCMALENGAKTYEINLDCGNDISSFFDHRLAGKASVTVPDFVAKMLSRL